jgi:anti-sigma factor RsiW
MVKDEDQELVYKYLLGELSDDQQTAFERRYFADDALFERLIAAEDELIDRYARGECSDKERALLEQHFLKSQSRRKRLLFSQALVKHLSLLSEEVKRQRASWWDELKSLLRIKGR